MIKAEVISHEGNPAPNWLDRCRTLGTPASISTVVVVVAVIALSVGISHKHSGKVTAHTANTVTSQPAATAMPLSVQPLSTETHEATDGSPVVQSADGGFGTANPAGSEAAQTPLNTTGSTPDANQNARYNQQSTLRNRNLINGIQSTVPGIKAPAHKNFRLRL